MRLCKTDTQRLIGLLQGAAQFYELHAAKPKERDKVRQLNIMIHKLMKNQQNDSNEKE